VDPALLIIMESIDFDRAFILASGAFLTEAIIDSDLRFQLGNALEAMTDDRFEQSRQRAIRFACLALAYLFESPPNVFKFPAHPFGSWTQEEANDPATSFDASLAKSCFRDAMLGPFGAIFTALSFYYALYNEKIVAQREGDPGEAVYLPSPDELLPVELALSLQRYVSPLWATKEGMDSATINHILDFESRTEVFRRLSGFECMVQKMLRSMLEPLEEEKARWEAAKRAELALARVEAHLRAHATYYTTKYFEHLGQQVSLTQYSVSLKGYST
jgi:hypothetical protein